MKLATIIGTRPETIRLSQIITKLDDILGIENHNIIWTSQNYTKELSTIFFEEFNIRNFDYIVPLPEGDETWFEQQFRISSNLHSFLMKDKPDGIIILGDTNSCMATTLVAKKLNIPIYHLEAGNRSFNPEIPEEMNRKVIDHLSDFNLCYTNFAKQNLLDEGINKQNIFLCGNPIVEIIKKYYNPANLNVLTQFDVEIGKYNICTLHRNELVNNPERLFKTFENICLLSNLNKITTLISLHPTMELKLNKLTTHGCLSYRKWFKRLLDNEIPYIKFFKPSNFKTFLNLERFSNMIITDSGTVIEEAVVFNKKCLCIREKTERWEVMQSGNMIISGYNNIFDSYKWLDKQILNTLKQPEGYEENVSQRVVNYILSKGKM